MSDTRPQDEPVEAEVIHEAQEVPPPRRKFEYVPPKKNPFVSPPVLLVLLVFVGALAFLNRGKLTETYDRVFGEPKKEEPAVPVVTSPEPEPLPEPQPPVEPEPGVKLPPPPKRGPETEDDLPVEPVKPLIVHEPPPPGIAYSIVDRKSLSFGRVFRYEMKVVVPRDYAEADILRNAKALVRAEGRKRLYHALRLLIFTDREKLDPDDALAEVVWAPEGNFGLAERAARETTQANEFRVTMKKR